MMKIVTSQKGFTLIEIIAVLIILGILAAVAVPRYVDMQGAAKRAAAQGQIAEMKSTLNLGYAKYFLSNSAAATNAAQVITMAGFASGTATNIGVAPDVWSVTLTASGTSATVLVTSRNLDLEYTATGTWNMPQ